MRHKIINLFLCLIFLSNLTSCVFLTENSLDQFTTENSFLNRFPQNHKTIIIFKITGKKGSKVKLCNFDQKTNCHKIHPTKKYQILMMQPGKYYLQGLLINNPIFSKIKADEKKVIFNIKAGEIAYIGDLSMKTKRDENGVLRFNGFRSKDNFKKITQILTKKKQSSALKEFPNHLSEIKFLLKQFPNWEKRLKNQILTNHQ